MAVLIHFADIKKQSLQFYFTECSNVNFNNILGLILLTKFQLKKINNYEGNNFHGMFCKISYSAALSQILI